MIDKWWTCLSCGHINSCSNITCTNCIQSTQAFNKQVGGNHYKDMPIQPAEFIIKNDIGWAEGTVIKYVARWKKKGGLEDLKKARHILDMLIEIKSTEKPEL